jgi:hypothetical protein
LVLDADRLSRTPVSGKKKKVAKRLMLLLHLKQYRDAEALVYPYVKVLQRAWLTYIDGEVASSFKERRNCQHAPVDKEWLKNHKDCFLPAHINSVQDVVRAAFSANSAKEETHARWKGPDSWKDPICEACSSWAASDVVWRHVNHTIDSLFEQYRLQPPKFKR